MRILLVGLLLSGCSVAFMEPVPDTWHPSREPRCTESSGFILWDGLIAVTSLVAAGAIWATANSAAQDGALNEDAKRTAYIYMGALGLNAIIHGTSAGVGTKTASKCRNARERRDVWLANERRRLRSVPPVPVIK